MTYESRSCMFLLLVAVAGFLSVAGAGIAVKYVCPGDSVQAFQNIEYNCTANVHLVKHVDENAEIAVWSNQNCIRNESLQPEYQGKLIFDQNGTITIKNFDNSDQANYIVIVNHNSKMDTLPKIYEVQLSLMVAPTKDCKPMIEQLEKILIARLNATYCGKPVAVPYWKDSDSGFNTDQPILKLTPGMEARKYNACIKGAALTCVKNVTAHDYCTTFTTEGNETHTTVTSDKNTNKLDTTIKCDVTGFYRVWVLLRSGNSPTVSSETSSATERIATSTPVSSETSGANEHIAVCIILIILVILAMVVLPVIFLIYRRRKKNVNDEQTTMLLEIPNPWTNDFGKLDWEEIRKLLNDDQQMGLQTYCDNLKLQNDNHSAEIKTQCDLENDIEEAKTELQSCNDPEKLRVLIHLRDHDLCKICLVNKSSVCFIPCNHIVTCTICSSSLPKCPLCREVIEELLPIYLA